MSSSASILPEGRTAPSSSSSSFTGVAVTGLDGQRESSSSGLTGGAVAGVVVGGLVGGAVLLAIAGCCWHNKNSKNGARQPSGKAGKTEMTSVAGPGVAPMVDEEGTNQV